METFEDVVRRYGSPLYVYDEAELRARCRSMAAALPDCRFLFAMKANSNPTLLKIIHEEGLGADAVSAGEVALATHIGIPPEQVSYNGNNVTDDEMRAVMDAGVHVSVDSVSQLERYGTLFPGTSVGIRLNPDVGDGHHDHVITGGPDAKFGIDPEDLADARILAVRHDLTIDGLQQHIGSGILNPKKYMRGIDAMLRIARDFANLRFIDFGGGFGLPYQPKDTPFDLEGFAVRADKEIDKFRGRYGAAIEFRFEPGRYIVGTCGTLLVTVTSVKRGKRHTFVGTDSGFHHLLRPTLYGAYHRIVNLSHPDARVERVTVAGNICESGDLFATDRALPMPRVGDVLAIRDAGAYGYSMASTYNLRTRPAEVLITGDGPRLIRRRETLEDLLRTGEGLEQPT